MSAILPAGPQSCGIPVRDRMLKAGRMLFAQNGFDDASILAIARAAGSSESQFIKQFGGKQGLLQAIFEEGWRCIIRRLDRGLIEAATPAEKIGLLAYTILEALEHDAELKLLCLTEGRRVTGHNARSVFGGGILAL